MLKTLSSQLGHITCTQQSDITALIGYSQCLFTNVPTCTTDLQHYIDVKDARPINSICTESTCYLLENGLAVPSSSSWSSPCLGVAIPDCSTCFTTYFRKVIAVIIAIHNLYPLPWMLIQEMKTANRFAEKVLSSPANWACLWNLCVYDP